MRMEPYYDENEPQIDKAVAAADKSRCDYRLYR